MDNVMRKPWMLRLLLEQLLENRSRLEPPRVGLVRGIFRSRDRECIEDLRLVVFRIFCRDLVHGVAISDQARSLQRVLVIAIQLSDGREVRAFALRFCTRSFAAFRALPPCL